MPATIDITSRITLESYVYFLRKIGESKDLKFSDTDGLERRIIKELIRSGYVSENEQYSEMAGIQFHSTAHLVITPEGFLALAEWSDYLKNQKWWYKTGSALVRFLWVIVGAIAATIPDVIKMLMP